MKKVIPAVVALTSFVVLSFLPLIPAESAAVGPPIIVPETGEEIARNHRREWVSLQDLFGLGILRTGTTYRMRWYSLLAALLVVGLAVAAGRGSRRMNWIDG